MKQHSENSEQILSDLDEHIAAVETILIELDGKSNRWQVIFTLHAAILWALSLIFSFFVIRRNGLEPAIFLGLPTVAGPGLIYYGRGAIRWFLKREQRKYYAKLSALRTRRTARRRPLQQEQGIPKRNEYRLICKQCYAYNGIVQDPKDLQFVCPRCFKFNPMLSSGLPVAAKEEDSSIASRVKRSRRSAEQTPIL